MKQSILMPYQNCWRIDRVHQLAVLIDGNNYYQALFNLLEQAQQTVFIAAWEMESRLDLKKVDPSFPSDLRQYFKKLVQDNQNLQVAIACWKPAKYLGFSREPLAWIKWKLLTDKRVLFRQDQRPIYFSAYHEKLAVIDNNCAFIGGMDLSIKRWDTRKHFLKNKLRASDQGKPYRPVHDVQVVLNGQLVKSLTHLFAKRMGQIPRSPQSDQRQNLWPSTHLPALSDITAGVARTEPLESAFEIERFYLDVIQTAKQFIFIENQYLTHTPIVDALCKRLKQTSPPEVIVILPYSYSGIWERSVFNYQRNFNLIKLVKADQNQKLAILYPSVKGEDYKNFIQVHSKLMVVDGRYMTIGSANLSHRSMRVDREINLVLDSEGDHQIEQFCFNLVHQLLSEHLSIPTQMFEQKYLQTQSLIDSIDFFRLQNTYRSLRPVPLTTLRWFERVLCILAPLVDMHWVWSKRPVHMAMISLVILLLLSLKGGLI